MTRRDLIWRGGGLMLFALACVLGMIKQVDASGSLGLLGFALALFGMVMVIQGRHIPAALKIERGRHRDLPLAIHARRRRRSGDGEA